MAFAPGALDGLDSTFVGVFFAANGCEGYWHKEALRIWVKAHPEITGFLLASFEPTGSYRTIAAKQGTSKSVVHVKVAKAKALILEHKDEIQMIFDIHYRQREKEYAKSARR